eukprot:TRINITY_DN14143_c0_g1_i1.p1 TRINITY_DN14143_c0_g1~~TRINITY_DN14143_c0_g1_i1.p1  ORF type:complete len:301 (+),score=93.89 TRINITY_DN14143_c0_g1_i1:176-1078(+)
MQGLKEFALEVDLVSPLRHPAIVKLVGVAHDGPNLALVYPFFKKGPLEGHLLAAQLGWEARLHIARDMAEGVGVLHALQPPILHRDLSPDNVLLTEDLRAKLTDFGTARECPELLTGDIVRDEPRGKWHYMAPEVRDEGQWSRGADVYALGVMLLQLLAGSKEPTVDSTHLSLLSLQQLPRAVPWPDRVRREFFDLARRCLGARKDRIDCWKLAAGVQDLLSSALLEQCHEPAATIAITRAAARDCAWCERRPRGTRLSCGHAVLCEPCTKEVLSKFGMCPVCQTNVSEWSPLPAPAVRP